MARFANVLGTAVNLDMAGSLEKDGEIIFGNVTEYRVVLRMRGCKDVILAASVDWGLITERYAQATKELLRATRR